MNKIKETPTRFYSWAFKRKNNELTVSILLDKNKFISVGTFCLNMILYSI